MTHTPTIWKIRAVKSYPEAHNHLLIGRVIERDTACVTLHCRSFHFGRTIHGIKGIGVGKLGTRIIPWSRIELINELETNLNYQIGRLRCDDQGDIYFGDGKNSCLITSQHDRRY